MPEDYKIITKVKNFVLFDFSMDFDRGLPKESVYTVSRCPLTCHFFRLSKARPRRKTGALTKAKKNRDLFPGFRL
jgi:hypothetical protein